MGKMIIPDGTIVEFVALNDNNEKVKITTITKGYHEIPMTFDIVEFGDGVSHDDGWNMFLECALKLEKIEIGEGCFL